MRPSDAPGVRWTLRGVPREVRRLALAKAKSRGLTVAEYVADLIRREDPRPQWWLLVVAAASVAFALTMAVLP